MSSPRRYVVHCPIVYDSVYSLPPLREIGVDMERMVHCGQGGMVEQRCVELDAAFDLS